MAVGQDVEIEPIPADEDEEDVTGPIGPPLSYYEDFTRPEHGREELGDIRVRRQPPTHETQVRPSYFNGDEYIPANWPSTNIWQMQQWLAKVGLLTGTFTRNTWDTTTRNAYKQLLGIANSSGLTAEQALAELLATSGTEEGQGTRYTVDEFGNLVPAGGGSAPPPLVTRTTDPTELRSAFRAAVIERLGEGWSQEQINSMVAAYNQLEVKRQTEAYNMEVAGQAGSITDIPSPAAFIESEIVKKDPVGVQTQEALGFTQEFMDLAGSPAWGIG